jgi:polyhydroxyalkanoate synthesis regulator phasin
LNAADWGLSQKKLWKEVLMEDLFKKTLSFGIGLFDYTKEKVEKLVDEMVKRGEINKQDTTKTVEELWDKASKEQSAFWNKVKTYITSIVDEMAMPSKADFKALEDRVAALEKRVSELQNQPPA